MHLTWNIKCQTIQKVCSIPSKNFKTAGSTYVYLLVPETFLNTQHMYDAILGARGAGRDTNVKASLYVQTQNFVEKIYM